MVQGLKVTPITRTNVKVTWDPLGVSDFNGDAATGGYIVEYRELTDYTSNIIASSAYPQVELKGISRFIWGKLLFRLSHRVLNRCRLN